MVVQQLVLTADDIATVRLERTPSSFFELVSSAHHLRSSLQDPIRSSWARQAIETLGSAAPSVMAIVTSGIIQLSDFCDPPPGAAAMSFDDQLENLLSAPRSVWAEEVDCLASQGYLPRALVGLREAKAPDIKNLGEGLGRFYDAAIRPHYDGILASTYQAQQAHAQRLMTEGVDGLLASLHPSITWKRPILEIDLQNGCGHSQKCLWQKLRASYGDLNPPMYLRGRGLRLRPSAFARHVTMTFPSDDLELECDDREFVVTFPIDSGLSNSIFYVSTHLNELLGPTRAAALRAIGHHPLTTTELARVIHISVGSASEHAKVLRNSALVETSRDGKHAYHRATMLGTMLMSSA